MTFLSMMYLYQPNHYLRLPSSKLLELCPRLLLDYV